MRILVANLLLYLQVSCVCCGNANARLIDEMYLRAPTYPKGYQYLRQQFFPEHHELRERSTHGVRHAPVPKLLGTPQYLKVQSLMSCTLRYVMPILL